MSHLARKIRPWAKEKPPLILWSRIKVAMRISSKKTSLSPKKINKFNAYVIKFWNNCGPTGQGYSSQKLGAKLKCQREEWSVLEVWRGQLFMFNSSLSQVHDKKNASHLCPVGTLLYWLQCMRISGLSRFEIYPRVTNREEINVRVRGKVLTRT